MRKISHFLARAATMNEFSLTSLSRRESQIMEIVYRRGSATAADVQAELPDSPGYSTVRKLLQVLEQKGHLEHEESARRYVYRPTVPREEARRSVLRQVVDTFFGGSAERAALSLLNEQAATMGDDELERLVELARRSEREGR